MAIRKRRAAGWSAFAKQYQRGLEAHIKLASRDRRPAGRMGRRAHGLGIETLALARIHDRALEAMTPPGGRRDAAARRERDERASSFFADAVSSDGRASDHESQAGIPQSHQRCSAALIDARDRFERESEKCRNTQAALEAVENRYETLLTQSHLMEERLRQLSRRLLPAQEEERVRISRDLHDAIGQALTGINVGLATLRNEAMTQSKEITQSIALTQRLVERSMETVHEFARELRPTLLDDLGLIPALRSHAKAFSDRNGLRLRFVAVAGADGTDADRRTALFRVGQEALTNVARHARANQVRISIRRAGGRVRLEVKDDGRSFDVKRMERSTKNRHLGLLGMQERMEMVGGRFSIESSPGRGTIVAAEVPANERGGG